MLFSVTDFKYSSLFSYQRFF